VVDISDSFFTGLKPAPYDLFGRRHFSNVFFKPRPKSPNRVGGGISDSMLNFPDKKINGLDALLVQVLHISAAAISFRRIKPVESPILLL
jgi:hypothetical protein